MNKYYYINENGAPCSLICTPERALLLAVSGVDLYNSISDCMEAAEQKNEQATIELSTN